MSFASCFRVLKIDSREIFNAKMPRESEAQYQLCVLAENYTEEEAVVLVPVVESVKNALRKGDKIEYSTKKSLPSLINGKQALQLLTGSFAYGHFQFYNIYKCLFFASRTKKRKINHDGILIHSCLGSSIANWAWHPQKRFFLFHKIHHADRLRRHK